MERFAVERATSLLLKCLLFRLLAGFAIGVTVFGLWRAVDAPMPWPFLRLSLGAGLGIVVFRFFWSRSSLLGSFLAPTPTDAAALPQRPAWLYGLVCFAGVAATVLVAF